MAGVADGSADDDGAEDGVDEESQCDVSGDAILEGSVEAGADLLESSDVKAALDVELVAEEWRQLLQFA